MTHIRREEWATDFINGQMGLSDFEWLGRYIKDNLTAFGVPAPTASLAAETLQADIAGLFEARELAKWGLGELERLDERDRLRDRPLE